MTCASMGMPSLLGMWWMPRSCSSCFLRLKASRPSSVSCVEAARSVVEHVLDAGAHLALDQLVVLDQKLRVVGVDV